MLINKNNFAFTTYFYYRLVSKLCKLIYQVLAVTVPSVEKIDGCRLPKFPLNGRFSFFESDISANWDAIVPFFTFIQYSCDTGYSLVGSSISVCENPSWSSNPTCKFGAGERPPPTKPVLERLNPTCVLPNYPSNGKYSVIGGPDGNLRPGNTVELSTIIQFSCDSGYEVSGISLATCEVPTWSPTPHCVASSGRTSPRPQTEHRFTTTAIYDSGFRTGCALPPKPLHGGYSVANYDREIVPGNIVNNGTVIWPFCDEQYDPNKEFAQCRGSTWSSIPDCQKRCKMQKSHSVDFECRSPTYSIVPCDEYLPHGSIIHPACKDGHLQPLDLLSDIECNEGRWNSEPRCNPDCGYEKSFGISHIVNAPVTKKNSFPWHVGIYLKNRNSLDQICGGTLLHTHIVITAAHCFFDEQKKRTNDKELYQVAAGKYYRAWNHPSDIGVQHSKIKQIIIPNRYRGDEQNHQSDIAILELEEPFRFHDSIHPACYDLSLERHNTFHLQHDSLGKVAGWGITETGLTSEELRVLQLPVVRIEDCAKELNNYNYNRYLTLDKICAGYLNGSAVCKGDSGGGLMFPTTEFGGIRWYLRGIVSNGPLADDGFSCRPNTYTAFTHVFYLRQWIYGQLRNLDL